MTDVRHLTNEELFACIIALQSTQIDALEEAYELYKATSTAWEGQAFILEGQLKRAQGNLETALSELEEALTDKARLEQDLNTAHAFITNLCDMVALKADMKDIADECNRWSHGVWELEAEGQRRSDPQGAYKWKVMVVEHDGDDAVFTGWFDNYDLARETVDLMIARGCSEAWVEELI